MFSERSISARPAQRQCPRPDLPESRNELLRAVPAWSCPACLHASCHCSAFKSDRVTTKAGEQSVLKNDEICSFKADFLLMSMFTCNF